MTTQASPQKSSSLPFTFLLREASARVRTGLSGLPPLARSLWHHERHWLLAVLSLAFIAFRTIRWISGTWGSPEAPLFFEAWVPLGALALLWHRRDAIRALRDEINFLYPASSAKRYGSVWPLGVGMVLMLLSCVAMYTQTAVLALVILLAGSVYYLYGAFYFRLLWQPLLFLLLLIPPPFGPIIQAIVRLQLGNAAVIGPFIELFHKDAHTQGIHVIFPGYTLEVTGAVSGLNLLLPCLVFALWYILLRQARFANAVVTLVVGGAIALLVNVIRLFAIGMVGAVDAEAADRLHDFPSLPWLIGALLLTFYVSRLLIPRSRVFAGYGEDAGDIPDAPTVLPGAAPRGESPGGRQGTL